MLPGRELRSGGAARVLELQRTAGNSATTLALTGGVRSVQRDGFWDPTPDSIKVLKQAGRAALESVFALVLAESRTSSSALTPPAEWDHLIDCYARVQPIDGAKLRAARVRGPQFHLGGLVLGLAPDAVALTMDTDIFVKRGNWNVGTYVHELIHVHQYAGGRAKFVTEYYSALLLAYLDASRRGTTFDPMKGSPEEQEAYAVSDEHETGRFDVWNSEHGAACLAPAPAPVPPAPTRLPSTVLFDTDKSMLKPEAAAVLAPLLPGVRASAHPEVLGYADATGGPVHNQALSENRARAVAAWLERQDPSLRGKISVRGLGTASPVADNATASGRSQNRRVEIVY